MSACTLNIFKYSEQTQHNPSSCIFVTRNFAKNIEETSIIFVIANSL